jgi:prophage antirepressor-like protein
MTELELFTYNDHEVRTVIIDGELWMVAKDVCDVLEIKDVSMALKALDEDEKGTSTVGTPGGPQEMSIISEPGLFHLLNTSRKPAAKPFKRWVNHEVLPALRKTGVYATTDKAVVTTREKSEALELLQYKTRIERKEAKELKAEGLYRNTVTGKLELRPGAVTPDEVPKLVESYVRERSRQASRSFQRGDETPGEFLSNGPWVELESGANS